MSVPCFARLVCLAMVPYLLGHGATAPKAVPAERFTFSVSTHGLDVELTRSQTASR